MSRTLEPPQCISHSSIINFVKLPVTQRKIKCVPSLKSGQSQPIMAKIWIYQIVSKYSDNYKLY